MCAPETALQAGAPLHPSLERCATIARLPTDSKEVSPKDALNGCALCADLNVSALRAWGIAQADLPAVVEKEDRPSSMQANPLPLTDEEPLAVVSAVW
jgi:alcohol dehydrogenase class IV